MADDSQKKTAGRLPDTPNPESPNVLKQLALTGLGLLVLTGYFMLPMNKLWLEKRPVRYFQEMPLQMAKMDVEQRLLERHQINYEIPRLIAEALPDSARLLLPPRQYAKTMFSGRIFQWYHAAWNYYFFGPRRMANYEPGDSLNWRDFTHAIIISNSQYEITPEKAALLSLSAPLIGTIVNERKEEVAIWLLPLESPAAADFLLNEYLTGSIHSDAEEEPEENRD